MQKNNDASKLRVVFMGTSELSEAILSRLISEDYNIIGVFTKPDMKVGRKHEIVKPAVKILAEKNSLDVYQPEKFKIEGTEKLKELNPDLVVVAAYGKILPKSALEIPKFGCINVHVSLLPKYRGPSPVQNALLQGETETGVTIMLMDEGVDTGDILTQEKITIDPEDNTESLMKKLSDLGADALVDTIPLWTQGKIQSVKQDHSQATSCKLIKNEDGHINWNDTAENIHNRFRAMTPWPGIFSFWDDGKQKTRLRLLFIKLSPLPVEEKNATGAVFKIENQIAIQTGHGVIILETLQKEGKKPTDAKSFANGYSNFIGSLLQ